MAAKKIKDPIERMKERTRQNFKYRKIQHQQIRQQDPTHQPRKPSINKVEFMRAIPGTGGVLCKIADNLQITRDRVARLLERPDWMEVRDYLFHEMETAADKAETAINEIIDQRLDTPSRLRAACYLLEHRRKSIFGQELKVKHEGGDSPIRVLGINLDLNALSVDVKRQLLELAEATEAKMQGKDQPIVDVDAKVQEVKEEPKTQEVSDEDG